MCNSKSLIIINSIIEAKKAANKWPLIATLEDCMAVNKTMYWAEIDHLIEDGIITKGYCTNGMMYFKPTDK